MIALYQYDKIDEPVQVLSNVEGTIYYTKRVEDVLTLFKSDANLEKEELVYSHKGKGSLGDGNWCLFEMEEIDKEPIVIRRSLDGYVEIETDYINFENDNYDPFIEKEGSLYILENGEEKLLKEFNGIYLWNWTGYYLIGESTDNRYLMYRSMEHNTPLGSLLDEIFYEDGGHMYIMDILTGESSRFVDSYQVQWVME